MLLRIIIIIGILLSLNGYVALQIINRWPGAEHHLFLAWFITAIFVVFELMPFVGRLFSHKISQKNKFLNVVVNWLPYLAFGIFSCVFLYSIVIDVISLAWQFFAMPADLEKFNLDILTAFAVITFGTVLIGVIQAVVGPVIVKIDIHLDNLPKGFDGFKIAQISDLHIGSTIGRSYVENVVKMTNDLKPDLIVLTGDIIEGTISDLSETASHLSELQAPHGRYLITGNHEYYWDAAGWIKEFRKYGLIPLLNDHVTIKHNGAEIILAGVTDYSTRHMTDDHATSPERALNGIDRDKTKILLAHQPATYEMAQKAGADLMLSGHTHNGQYFPYSLLIRFFQKYYKGLNRYKNMLIYINRGTGYWGPPLRTFVSSEITLLTLRPKK